MLHRLDRGRERERRRQVEDCRGWKMVNALLKAYETGDIKGLTTLLEKQALSASDSGDIETFKKSYLQLRPLYGDEQLQTQNSKTIIALHLLILLSESSISQFHSELESLKSGGKELEWVKSIEQGIMEGSYQEVRKLLASPPSKHFERWGSLMTTSIRSDIAECSESSYVSLPLTNLTTLLLLQNVKETEQFAGERGWVVKDGRVHFSKSDLTTSGTMPVDTLDGETNEREMLISQTLSYARELESIV